MKSKPKPFKAPAGPTPGDMFESDRKLYEQNSEKTFVLSYTNGMVACGTLKAVAENRSHFDHPGYDITEVIREPFNAGDLQPKAEVVELTDKIAYQKTAANPEAA